MQPNRYALNPELTLVSEKGGHDQKGSAIRRRGGAIRGSIMSFKARDLPVQNTVKPLVSRRFLFKQNETIGFLLVLLQNIVNQYLSCGSYAKHSKTNGWDVAFVQN